MGSIPKLCPGTFFSLLIQAKKLGSSKAEKLAGGVDGLNAPSMMEALMSLIYSDYKKVTPMGETTTYDTSRIRNCEEDRTTWLCFGERSYVDAVKDSFENDYYGALKRADTFIRTFLRFEEELILKRFFRAILQTIAEDPTIDGEQEFTILPNRGKVSKNNILKPTDYSFQAFLLGVWYFIVTSDISNKDGKSTINEWFKTTGKNKEKKFASEIGRGQNVKGIPFVLLSSGDDQFAHKTPQEEELLSTDVDYSSYLEKAKAKYSNVFTLLYEQAQPFRDIFVCSDLIFYYQDPSSKEEEIGWEEDDEVFLGRPYTFKNQTARTLLGSLGNRLIVGGTGGLGKSMMMRHFLLDACENYREYGMVPFFVSVREYNDERDLVDFVYVQTLALHGMSREEFKRILTLGKALLLFDGMDEILSSRQRQFESAIEDFTDRYSGNMFIIATRRFKKFDALANFKFLHLSPLTKPQALELIGKLKFREDIKKRFMKDLDEKFYDQHMDFVTNPLLLTILLLTFQSHPDVPSKMHLFYSEAYNALVHRHDASKGGFIREYKTKLAPDRFREYLTRFCAFSYSKEYYSFDKEKFYTVFDEVKEGFQEGNERVTATDFLDDMLSTVCVLYEEDQEYRFVHRSFQEYFTACFLCRKDDELFYPDIANFFDSDRETLNGDATFDMFYEMEPRKVEEHLFLPFLHDILGGIDKESERGFLTYLKNAYPMIREWKGHSFRAGEDDGTTPTKSFVLRFIKKHLGLEEYPRIEDIPLDGAFIVETYTEIPLPDIPLPATSAMGDAKKIAVSLGIDPDSLEEVGWDIDIDVGKLLSEKDLYPKLYAAVIDSSGEFYAEYSQILTYYVTLKGRKASKPSGTKKIFS